LTGWQESAVLTRDLWSSLDLPRPIRY